MSIFYLPKNASKARLREAENARKNRAEILKAYSQGQVSRRELIKWGLITTGGIIAPIGGLSPFVAYASGGSGSGGSGSSGSGSGTSSNIPTGMPPSPLFGVQAFTTAMPRFDVVPRNPMSSLTPTPTAQANQTQQPLEPRAGRRKKRIDRANRRASAWTNLGTSTLRSVPSTGRT